jgi:hypothetical protein
VRGHDLDGGDCRWNDAGECTAFEALLGRRLLVGNVEVRVPLAGLLSGELQYGPVPLEGFVFADGGISWARTIGTREAGRRARVVGLGAGVRVNALGIPVEVAAARGFTPTARGWSFDVAFRPAF